jgi:S-(hydroxymethyl)glutathione dehydrogenase/alcohol dehydrogenase
MMKTKAAVLYQTHQPLQVETLNIPEPDKGQVLVRMKASGLCRSQLNEWRGLKGPDRFLPHLMGHEGAGIVEAIGPLVNKIKEKDHVLLSWIKGEGMDVPCSQYYNVKGEVINSGAVATFSEYALVSENRVSRIPKTFPWDIAAFIGCAVATGGGIVLNTLQVKQDRALAVWGIGGVGASAILAAKMLGCRRIIAVDICEEKLRWAETLGATAVADARAISVGFSPYTKKFFPVDYAIESSGSREAMEWAFATTADQGIVVIAGNLRHDEKMLINPFDLIKGKQIIGSWGGSTVPERDFPRYIRAYQAGKMRIDQLITHRLRLEEINHAFHILDSGRAGRVLIEF